MLHHYRKWQVAVVFVPAFGYPADLSGVLSASWRESALLRERVRCISDHSGSSHPTYYYCPELRRVLVFLFPPVRPVAAAHTSERGNTSQKVIQK